uniref:17.06 kDa salivary PpSP15-like protein n=1 Tax=Phlebotomus sergenti TaxID=85759 RepID=F6K8K6_9DIPT
MKYLAVVVLTVVSLIGTCQAETPENKCIAKHRANNLKETCIPQCKYEYYGFVGPDYNITYQHVKTEIFYRTLINDNDFFFLQIRTFSNTLIKYNAFDVSKKHELRKLMQKCEKRVKNQARNDSHWLNCRTTIEYYRCIGADPMINYGKFDKAIIEYDKTINV